MSLPNLGALARVPPKGPALDEGEETAGWSEIVNKLDKGRLPEDIKQHILSYGLHETIPDVRVNFAYRPVGNEQATDHFAKALLMDSGDASNLLAELQISKEMDHDPYPDGFFRETHDNSHNNEVHKLYTMTEEEREEYLEAQYKKPLQVLFWIDQNSEAGKALLELALASRPLKADTLQQPPDEEYAYWDSSEAVEYTWQETRPWTTAFTVTKNMRHTFDDGSILTACWVEFAFPLPGDHGWFSWLKSYGPKLFQILCTTCPLTFGTALKALRMESKRGGKNGEPLPWYTAQLDDMWGKYEKTMRELRRTELLDRLPGEQRVRVSSNEYKNA